MLIFVSTNKVWGMLSSLYYLACIGVRRWLECLVIHTLWGGVSEPSVMAQISICCASYLASLTPSLNVNICFDQQSMRHMLSSWYLACIWVGLIRLFWSFFEIEPMIRMFGHRTLWGGASEPGKIAQISISCASDLASLMPSLNVNICFDQQCMRHLFIQP